MEIELVEIRDYIAACAPFDVLPAGLIDEVPRKTTIRYLRRGQSFPPDDLQEDSFVVLRSGAIELRDEFGNLREKLSEGDVFGEACQAQMPSAISGVASEDSLLYLLPCSVIGQLCDQSEIFRQYIARSAQQRLKHAIASMQSGDQAFNAMHLEVGGLTDRQPVMVNADITIQQAAQIMSAENVSSILVMRDNRLAGMVTDRDLRNRCIAGNVSRHQPVVEVMTKDLITIEHNMMLSDALLIMTRHQIHHIPVLKNHKPIGNLTVSDIIRQLGANPAFIASDIHKANSVDALARISRRIPELQLQLANANTSAHQVGEVISSISDALTRRLIELAEQKLGPPPVSYVWVASGSQARNEQTCHSDQDNALIIGDAIMPEHDEYFEELTRLVSDGLNTCGYPYCPGNAMATNPQWRQPLHQWQDYFSNWIERPEKKALMLSSIFFDMRAVFGNDNLLEKLQSKVLEKTRANRIFIAFMVSNALQHKPPLGFFRNFVLVHDGEHNNTLDIKHRGVVPIVDIARVYALAEGISEMNTVERLRAAQQRGALSKEMCENLIDAFEFIGRLRIQHQAQQIRLGLPVDNYLPPDNLSGLERNHLKDAFHIIKTMQEVLESRHQAARLA
jgi:CBS domain-containing protein